jgi:hypothetical protein
MPNDRKPIDEQLVALHFHSQVDYEERLVAALRRAKVPTADIEEIISTESERRSANGKVMRIWTQPDAVSFDLVIKGLLGGQSRVGLPENGIHWFRFKTSETEFLAEARRAQSSNLMLIFTCYLRKPLSWNLVERVVSYGVDSPGW